MAERDQVLRFAVGEPFGKRSAIYRLWTPSKSRGKGDVYLGMSEVAGSAKVSLHANRGHLGLSHAAAQVASLPSRFVSVWDRDDSLIQEGELAFELIIPTSELQTEPLGSEDPSDPRIVWLPAAPENMVQSVGLILSGMTRANEILSDLPPFLKTLARFDLGTGDVCLALSGVRSLSPEVIASIELQKDGARMGNSPIVGEQRALRPGDRTLLGYRRGSQSSGWIETNLFYDARTRAS
jgi:hypothetical protein